MNDDSVSIDEVNDELHFSIELLRWIGMNGIDGIAGSRFDLICDTIEEDLVFSPVLWWFVNSVAMFLFCNNDWKLCVKPNNIILNSI